MMTLRNAFKPGRKLSLRPTSLFARKGRRSSTDPRPKYVAFLSYSHHDREIGEWLQRRLEQYRVPSPLVGLARRYGPIEKRLGKIFRDRVDLSATHDLGAAILTALDDSGALIVLCSPDAARSTYVEDEVRVFKSLGRKERIFAAIVRGEPYKTTRPGWLPEEECFPPSLIYKLLEDGRVSHQPEDTEPLAADLRDGRDGRENGALKLVAGLLEVGLDELVQREAQAQARRRRRLTATVVVMIVLTILALVSAFGALRQRDRALTAESSYLAREAYRLSEEEDDHAAALLLALSGLPTGTGILFPRPYAAESERSLITVAGRNRLVKELSGHEGQVREAVFSGDGSMLATASWDGTARLWNIGSCGAEGCPFISLVGHESGVNTISFSFDGALAVTGSLDNSARIFRTDDGSLLAVLEGAGDRVAAASFSPRSDYVATASWDGAIRIYDLQKCISGDCSWSTHQINGRRVERVFYSPDGRRLVASTEIGTVVWDLEECPPGVACPPHVLEGRHPAISPDGSLLATACFSFKDGHTVRVWSLEECANGRCPYVKLMGHRYFIGTLDFSSDGKYVVSGSDDRTARVWDLETCRNGSCEAAKVLEGHTDSLRDVSFSPSGARIITASGGATRRTGMHESGNGRLWTALTEEPVVP